jgi:chromosome segregation ATPase
MQLCALFERVSGSMKLKSQYEDKKRIKRQAEEKHAEEAEQRSALAKRKGAIKAQKEEAEKYQQCQKEQVHFLYFCLFKKLFMYSFRMKPCFLATWGASNRLPPVRPNAVPNWMI